MVILKKYMKAGMDRSLYICYQNAYWFPNIYIKNQHLGCSITIKEGNKKRGLILIQSVMLTSKVKMGKLASVHE